MYDGVNILESNFMSYCTFDFLRVSVQLKQVVSLSFNA